MPSTWTRSTHTKILTLQLRLVWWTKGWEKANHRHQLHKQIETRFRAISISKHKQLGGPHQIQSAMTSMNKNNYQLVCTHVQTQIKKISTLLWT